MSIVFCNPNPLQLYFLTGLLTWSRPREARPKTMSVDTAWYTDDKMCARIFQRGMLIRFY